MQLPLKWQIQLWHALILLVVLSLLGTGFYFYEKDHRMAGVDEKLDAFVHRLMGPIVQRGKPPRHGGDRRGPLAPMPDPTPTPPDGTFPGGWERRVSAVEGMGRRTQRTPGDGGMDEHSVFEEKAVPQGFYAWVVSIHDPSRTYLSSNLPEISLPVDMQGGYFLRTRNAQFREIFHVNPDAVSLIGVDLNTVYRSLDLLKLQIFGVLAGIFIISLAVGSGLVARVVSPVARIENTASEIAGGDLSARIPQDTRIRTASEFERLAKHLNIAFTQLEAAFNRQTRFTADASHELRTPLTVLLAQVDYGLKRMREPHEYVRILGMCQRSSQRIQRITEQLMELARYDSGQVRLTWETLSLETMIRAMVEELEPFAESAGHRLVTEVEDDTFRCDPFRLEQVLTNLVNNAIQHNADPITITLHGRMEETGAVIEVSDNGKGIQPENLDRLFDRFFQESPDRHSEDPDANTGLGLSISQAIVEAHHGSLSVRSAPGVQTIFTLRLPI